MTRLWLGHWEPGAFPNANPIYCALENAAIQLADGDGSNQRIGNEIEQKGFTITMMLVLILQPNKIDRPGESVVDFGSGTENLVLTLRILVYI